jgi:putative redox protein
MPTQAFWTPLSGKTAGVVRFDNDELPVDVEVAAGGAGVHPVPHDLLDAALAACTTLTLQLYIKRKGWDVQEVRVEVAHAKEGAAYAMTRTVHVAGTLSEEQRASLLRIAQACPVHKTLSGEIRIGTTLES